MIEFVNHSHVELINTNASDDMVAMAAWVSFDSDKEERLKDREGVGKLINFLWKNKHTSPFEHGMFTFKVTTPIFVAREFHRHRAASYNEKSGRYTEMTGQFYIPPVERPLIQTGKPGHYQFERGSNEQYALMKVHMEKVCDQAWKSYNDMMAFGIAKEVARDILPLNTVTQFYASMNPRNLMHFLGLRAAPDALWEIREVAHGNADLSINLDEIRDGMERHLAEHMPLTYKAFNEHK